MRLLYTDGSRLCSDNERIHVGSAIVIPSMSIQLGFSLNNLSNSYTAEITAILKGMLDELERYR